METRTAPTQLTSQQLRDELADITRKLYVFAAPLPPDAPDLAARSAALEDEYKRRAAGGDYPGRYRH